jgi:hypothetical protein
MKASRGLSSDYLAYVVIGLLFAGAIVVFALVGAAGEDS